MNRTTQPTVMTSAAWLVVFSTLARDANPPAKDADNAARDANDRSNQTLTPFDQFNSK